MSGPRSAPTPASWFLPVTLLPLVPLSPGLSPVLSSKARLWGPQQLVYVERGNFDSAQDPSAPWHLRGLELGLLVCCVRLGGTDLGSLDKDTAALV